MERTFILYNKTYRDVLEDGVLTRCVYVKSSKEWKKVFILGEKWVFFNISEREVPINKIALAEHPFTGDEIYEKFLDKVSEKHLGMRFWYKKLRDSKCLYFSYLGKLLRYEAIPETESLIIAFTDARESDARIPALNVLNDSWIKEKNKKGVINNYRKYVEWAKETIAKGDYIRHHLWSYKDLKNIDTDVLDPDASLLNIGFGEDKITKEDLKWLRDKYVEVDDSLVREYHDWLVEYAPVCIDISDKYFRHNKNWRRMHQKNIKRECWHTRMNGLRIFLDLPVKDYRNIAEVKKFQKVYSKYKDWEMYRDDLHIYISSDIHEWEKRAQKLRQCIVSNKYYIQSSCILVFIDRGGQPAYTAEILKDNRIGQFMGDERDFQHCRDIPEDARQLLKDFLSQYKIK